MFKSPGKAGRWGTAVCLDGPTSSGEGMARPVGSRTESVYCRSGSQEGRGWGTVVALQYLR